MEREQEWQDQGGGEQSTEGGPTGVDPEDAEADVGESGAETVSDS